MNVQEHVAVIDFQMSVPSFRRVVRRPCLLMTSHTQHWVGEDVYLCSKSLIFTIRVRFAVFKMKWSSCFAWCIMSFSTELRKYPWVVSDMCCTEMSLFVSLAVIIWTSFDNSANTHNYVVDNFFHILSWSEPCRDLMVSCSWLSWAFRRESLYVSSRILTTFWSLVRWDQGSSPTECGFPVGGSYSNVPISFHEFLKLVRDCQRIAWVLSNGVLWIVLWWVCRRSDPLCWHFQRTLNRHDWFFRITCLFTTMCTRFLTQTGDAV